jgi:hypothetical protein
MAATKERLRQVRVRAKYRLNDVVLANAASRRRLSRNRPALVGVQEQIVSDLLSQGLATAKFATLFSDELWEQLTEESSEFVALIEGELEQERSGKSETKRIKKSDFIRRRFGRNAELDPSDPWLGVGISDRMLAIANTYLGMWTKLTYVDQWYTVPMPGGLDRRASQLWHRDSADKHLLKVFVYLNDVDEGAGPFEYVCGSARKGPYSGEWPWRPLGNFYPPQDELRERVDESAVRTLTGPAGTMIFCDTSGFHRGGFATERPRSLRIFAYSSPASLLGITSRRFTVGASGLPDSLSAEARFALA